MIAAVADAIDYAVPGPLTDLASVSPSALEHIPSEPVDVCRPAHTLVIQPSDAKALDLPNDRFSENQLRPAAALIGALLALDPAPLDVPRGPDLRVIGTCRHFAVLSCALLRYHGIAARVRGRPRPRMARAASSVARARRPPRWIAPSEHPRSQPEPVQLLPLLRCPRPEASRRSPGADPRSRRPGLPRQAKTSDTQMACHGIPEGTSPQAPRPPARRRGPGTR
jgi:hypothetical protein